MERTRYTHFPHPSPRAYKPQTGRSSRVWYIHDTHTLYITFHTHRLVLINLKQGVLLVYGTYTIHTLSTPIDLCRISNRAFSLPMEHTITDIETCSTSPFPVHRAADTGTGRSPCLWNSHDTGRPTAHRSPRPSKCVLKHRLILASGRSG